MPRKQPEQKQTQRSTFKTAAIILLLLFAAAYLFAFFLTDPSMEDAFGNVALISIKGVITADSPSGLFSAPGASSTDIVGLLQKARDDPDVKGVILEINSPGGSAVASSEIGAAIKDVRKQNKTVVAWIRETGASGAYWIAADSDHIVAHPLSITGSVGVISSYIDFAGLMDRYNVTYERLVAGSYKDMGTPYKRLTPQEEALFQEKLDKVQDVFLSEVATQRNLTKTQRAQISSGIFYLGSEAKDLNLVDELGGRPEAVVYLEKRLNESVTVKELKVKRSFWDALGQVMDDYSFNMGRGMASEFMAHSANTLSIEAR